MRIGELAAKAGVNIQTIRFYERQRLLREPSRTSSGYRAYAEADLQRVKFIKRCQHLGFTLKEVKGLIETHDPKQSFRDLGTRRKKNLQITRDRLQLIDEEMQLLKRMRQSLVAVLQQSESSRTSEPGTECTALREARKLEKECPCPRPVRRKKTS
jgi:MerR family mercuric resistance operon transcriptional regulator